MTGGRDGQLTGVLLMTFGAAATPEDVPAYMNHVYRGKAPHELIAEFQRRYRLVGGSPLTRITREQAEALEDLLNAGGGERYVVEIGMQHAPPFISEGLERLVERGCRRIVAIVLSPQYSPIIMGGYNRAVEEAQSSLPEDVEVTVTGAWHDLPEFLDALAQRTREALKRFPPGVRERVPVIFTAHSLPRSVVDREPHYIQQLEETARAVAERVGLPPERWLWAYQSAGHTPQEWLKPDVKDLLPGLRAAGHEDVLVVPVQFLADHLETLYDIDVDARAEAEEDGLSFHRIEMFNTMPEFIRCLAAVVGRERARPARAEGA